MIKIIRNSGQIEISCPHGRTFLYTENAGSKLLSAVHTAISKKKYWDDADHLAALIYDEMISDDDNPEHFAIGTQYFVDVNLFISVDTVNQKIAFDSYMDINDKFSMTFDEFLHNFFKSAKL
jgi:hypothetical protein